MKVAVTGATGFLGEALVERLLERGHEVRALVRRPEAVRGRFARGVTLRPFDAFTPPAPDLLEGMDAVVHLAGTPLSKRWTAAHKAEVRESRVRGTRAISEAAVASRTVQVMVSASAVGFYGDRGAVPLGEDASAGEGFLSEVCQAWEASADEARRHGIRTVSPRIGIVLHPEGGALAKMLPAFKLGVGGKFGSGEQYMSWIHRDDVVSLLAFALETPSLEGPVNATSPHPCTNAEFTHALARAVHRPALLSPPALALRMGLGEMASMLLEGQRVLPKKALEAGFGFKHPTLDEALEDLLTQKAA